MKSSELKKLQRQATKEIKTRQAEAHATLYNSLPTDWLEQLKVKFGSVEKASAHIGCYKTSPYDWYREKHVPRAHLTALLDIFTTPQSTKDS